ncbi:MAG: ArsR/SmtB family transcription factor [Candidatus Margulisiibacteriota bacterium]
MALAYDQLSATFQALSDPTRLQILHRLSQKEATVTELSEPFNMSMPAITKHLKVLENAGLITRQRQAQQRPCKIHPQGFQKATDWILEHKKLWDDRFDRLEAYLETLPTNQTEKNN